MTDSGLGPIADTLKHQVDEHGFIDVGANVVKDLPISETEFNVVLHYMLKNEGYQVHFIRVEQMATGETKLLKVLVGPNVTKKEIFRNRNNIRLADFT